MNPTLQKIRTGLWALAFFYFFSPLTAQSPELARAREWVDQLTSTEFAGRGYQQDGHLKAATWIARQFRSLGLETARGPATQDTAYFQRFYFTVNLIDTALLGTGKSTLRAGYDYIVNPGSGKGEKRKVKATYLGHGMPDQLRKFKGGIAVFREGLPEEITKDPELKKKYAELANDDVKAGLAMQMNADAVVVIRKKLTGGFSSMPMEKPYFEVVDSSLWNGKVKKLDFGVASKVRGVHSQNVVGVVKGSVYPDSVILLTAHYDHLGMLNNAVFAGANDNASGISLLLSLAAHYAKPENRPGYTLVFIAFGAEEVGLIGSKHYAEKQPLFPLKQTRFILNLDLMGNGTEGITAVAGEEHKPEFNRLVALNDSLKAVPAVKSRKNAPNSDHYFFVEKGVRGMFIYTLGGPRHYHDVYDIAANLQMSKFDELRRLFIEFVDGF